MKFAFLYEEGKIKNYKVEGNEIIINYLDDTTERMPYTNDDEQRLQEKMLEQAKERDEQVDSDFYKKKRRKELSDVNSYVIYTMLNTSTFFNTDLEWLRIAAGIMVFVAGGFVTYSSIQAKQLNDKRKELEKYRLYLSMIKENQNSIAPAVLKCNDKEVNINTLDNFSLRDIKKLNKTILTNRTK